VQGDANDMKRQVWKTQEGYQSHDICSSRRNRLDPLVLTFSCFLLAVFSFTHGAPHVLAYLMYGAGSDFEAVIRASICSCGFTISFDHNEVGSKQRGMRRGIGCKASSGCLC
jgi:hypothetical protein